MSIRERVGTFYMNNKQMEKSLIVKHFRFEGIPKSTIYSIINRVDNGISLDRQPGSGYSERIDQKLKNKIIEENVNEIGGATDLLAANIIYTKILPKKY